MKTAIVYLCNAGYLFPALVSAIGARRNTRPDEADIVIFDIGEASKEGEAIAMAAAAKAIRYRRIDPAVLDGMHVQFSRLVLDRFLPAEYSDFIYVDSDTQVWDRLDDFVHAPTTGGKVLASLDPMALRTAADAGDGGEWTSYIENLGLKQTTYVNSGVFKAERKAWSVFGEQAAKAVIDGKKYRFYDQDIINIVARDAIELISLKWNFPAFYLGSRLTKVVKPHLVHFMGNPRPWHGPLSPWGAAAWRPYVELANEFPELAPYWPRFKPLRYAKYVAQQEYRRFTETPHYQTPAFRAAVAGAEAQRAF